ncbi:hypothetical protein NP233_g7533 [Leucocoprinus birnbaumii]|uniref:CxC2-like cysteine cluster KDZ transposase-associated domain-containing protein n=1 Tax=Leucocoprinus birnbaumii TaxID=56174 RepID=A0AAD5VRP6_9AGAR|nr:hypothetical protein NP233_g7533 [Leucocoprinus birnbaumii]
MLQFPKTAFTFQALETFHQLSLSAKITTYDYYDSLKKMTNHTFPQDVEDRYRELMVVMRIWRHLAQCCHCSKEHDINIEFPHREAGSLTIRCPTCPEPGFNVDFADIMNALNTDTHTLTLFLSLDGNYWLNQKFKNSDPNDVALNKGNAYFVDHDVFQEYLRLHDDKTTQNSTCSKLKAVRQQQMIKFADSVYSGVVDTQYVRTDYALASALNKQALNQCWIMLSYDIWCQYLINLRTRIEERFPHLTPVIDKLRGAIPKLHIYGHGMTCGEGIESAWAEQNHAAGSTKEQSTGHHQDSLDNFNGYWNWSKVHRMLPSRRTERTSALAINEDDESEDDEAGSGEDDRAQGDTTEMTAESSKEEVVHKLTELIEEAIEIESMQAAVREQVAKNDMDRDNLSNAHDICQCAKHYRLAFQALTRLGLPADSELKPISDNNLWGKDMTSLRKKGDSKREEPWFWLIGKPKDCTDEQWQLELDRVRWFRTHALRDRLKEEVEILTVEFQRIITSFTKMDSVWRIVGERKQEAIVAGGGFPLVAQGFRNFAYRQAAMYQRLAHDAGIHWSEAARHTQAPRLPSNQ